ncbi:plasmid mobilization protein [Pinibacter aurantiacus]|uniref:Plasmid mobilization relaxosome protein MobC n=1 Tax=Pinibacter aurantiacus TaxID=2851599 RepID=A0A9E2SF97_9BACT|nr:plasmid mobilization relaxosome protein MobC [Pinibacter aurantiacus]MBV4359110.1 plasmid mobilization relaxosome protein MobC [Pinibacter aurantiacus]
MKEQIKTPKNWISFRVKHDEYTTIYHYFESTTCRKLSEYARKVLLNKPVTINYRNQSANEILTVMNQLKNELNAIGNNFNQSIHKLHTLDTVPEIKTWALQNEASKQSLLQKVEEIRVNMIQLYEQWSRK